MSGYEKRILYFDEIEDGRKVRNAGFTKLILQGDRCRILVNIKGLHKTDTIKCDLLLLEDDKEVALNRIYLQQGSCVYSCLLTEEQMGEKGIRPEELYGVCVRLSEQRFLKAVWRERKVQSMSEPGATPELPGLLETYGALEAGEAEIAEAEKVPQRREEPEKYEWADVEDVPEAWREPEVPEITDAREMPEARQITEPHEPSENRKTSQARQTAEASESTEERPVSDQQKPENPSQERISDNKWQQLKCVFPLIHPFGDEREYLSITPRDFIVLTREYQCLANNSFLLHGFYNYQHILLGKFLVGGKERFYLGVPGVFYEREKAVAVMFGFESFECAKEPAETGTFGYYMKRVEI